MSLNERRDRTVDGVSLMRAERVADLIRDHAWREMSLVDAVEADTPDLAKRTGLGRENGRIMAKRRTWETHARRELGSSRGPLRGPGRRLEVPAA
jgi:hypothetical protein